MIQMKTPKNPNVILIVIDNMGFGDAGYHGNQMLKTPTLDSLAEHSVTLEKFYCFPHLSDSYSGLLSGIYPDGTNHPNLVEILHENHYQHAIFENETPVTETRNLLTNLGLSTQKAKTVEHSTHLALEYIAQTTHPFFVCLFYHQPTDSLPITIDVPLKNQNLNLDQETLNAYAFFEQADQQLLRIQQAIKEQKLAENTLLVFVSSGGPGNIRFNNGLKGRKGQLDEGGVRVPSFLWYPAKTFQCTTQITFNSSLLDIAPTILSLANIPFDPVSFDGADLVPFFQSENHKIPDRKFYVSLSGESHKDSIVAIRYNSFLLTCTNRDTALFDLTADPFQRIDIKNQKTALSRELMANYRLWKANPKFQP